jgi:predicted HTH domain antitoxin
MPHVSIEIPDDLLLVLRERPGEVIQEIRLAAAVHYLHEKRLSLGQAARLAGMNRLDFLDSLAARGIPAFDLSAEDAVAEITAAKRTLPDDRK